MKAQVGADLGVGAIGFGLELDPHPAMAFKFFGKIDCGDSVGVGEKYLLRSIFFRNSFFEVFDLQVEHFIESLFRDIALSFAINGIAKVFVIGAHCFGNGT